VILNGSLLVKEKFMKQLLWISIFLATSLWASSICSEKGIVVNAHMSSDASTLDYSISFDVPTHCYTAKVLGTHQDPNQQMVVVMLVSTSKGLCAQSFKRIDVKDILITEGVKYDTFQLYIIHAPEKELTSCIVSIVSNL